MNKFLFILLFPILMFGQTIPANKILVGRDIPTMLSTYGHIQKGIYDANGVKGLTKEEIIGILWVDEVAISNYPLNRLMTRTPLVPLDPGMKSFMISDPPDNVYDNIHKIPVSKPMLHNGFYDLPQLGDIVYDLNEVPWYGINMFVGSQRYPAPGNDELNIRIAGTGYPPGTVTAVTWVTNRLTKPTNLYITNLHRFGFTLHFTLQNNYYAPTWSVDAPPGMTDISTTYNTGLTNYSVNFENAYDGTYTVWTYAHAGYSAPGSPIHAEFESIYVDIPPPLYSRYLQDSGTTGSPCQSSANPFLEKWTEFSGEPVIGTTIYANSAGTIVFIPPIGGTWYNSEGETYSYKIGSDGKVVAAVTNCQ